MCCMQDNLTVSPSRAGQLSYLRPLACLIQLISSRIAHFLNCGQQLQLYDAPEGLILDKETQGHVQQRAEP